MGQKTRFGLYIRMSVVRTIRYFHLREADLSLNRKYALTEYLLTEICAIMYIGIKFR